MAQCWEYICCCFTVNPTPVKKTPRAMKSRIISKHNGAEVQLTNQQRRQNPSKAYCCPICTLYYSSILACQECVNLICRQCCNKYEEISHKKKKLMRCAFCGSQKAKFVDYQLQPKSYFNTSNKGFISKEERERIDRELQEPNTFNLITVEP